MKSKRFAASSPGSGLARQRQRGAVLLVGMVMLVVAAMLGLAAIRTVLLQTRMAGGFASQNYAFQSGEIAIARGENVVRDRDPDYGISACKGASAWCYNLIENRAAPAVDQDWSAQMADAKVNYYGANRTGPSYARFRVERQFDIDSNAYDIGEGKKPRKVPVYRVDSYGEGISPEIWVVLQSMFKPDE